jgi:hypothetical protein
MSLLYLEKKPDTNNPMSNNATKLIILIVVIIGQANAYHATAQDFDLHELPGLDVFSRADNVSTRAYGDGDVNNDGKYATLTDAQAIYMGTDNDASDVNGINGTTVVDGGVIEDFANEKRDYLPGDINALNKLEGSNSEGVSKRRAEKMDWLNKMIAIDKTDEIQYTADFNCGQFSRLTAVNISGCKDFENYEYISKYEDQEITNGRFNTMQVYRVATTTQGSVDSDGLYTTVGGHWINGAFVGPINAAEKDDPTDFNQWYFWEPQTDKAVEPGDFSMNKDGDVNIYWFGQSSRDGEEWFHDDMPILSFDLSNGIATLDETFANDGINNYLMRENPHRAEIKLNSIEDKVFGNGENVVLGTPTVETNLEHYTPWVKTVASDTVYTDPSHFSFKVTNIAGTEMGRWSSDASSDYFLSNLGDTTSYNVSVDLGTGIEELTTTKSFDLDQNYPNPVNTTTTVPYASMGGDLEFRLIDIIGKTQKFIEKDNTYKGEGTFELDMSGMAPGQYVLMGQDENGSFDAIQIIKSATHQ